MLFLSNRKGKILEGDYEMECSNCKSDGEKRIVYACAGCADVGEVADQVGRKLRRDGFATSKVSCLIGVAAGLQQFIDAAQAAESVITIDGCGVCCAKKIVEGIDIQPNAVVLTTMGLVKGETPSSTELVENLAKRIQSQFVIS
jgi:uncharacterized metal-binding protein